MIVITGATGQLGSQAVEHLLARVPADQVGVSVRDPAKAAGLAERGVRVRRGDFADPASLAEAFAGAEQVLVVSADKLGPDGVALNLAAIDAAYAAGAERVLYTSHQNAAADSAFAAAADHAAAERHLEERGGAFTSLRNGFYASTVPWLVGDAARTGRLVAPADGPVSWTTIADLAEGAAAVLADPKRVDGCSPPLTAAEAVDMDGIAAILSDLTGRPVERVVVTDDEWVAGMVERGLHREQAELLLGLFVAARRGDFDETGPLLGELLGRAPASIRSVLADTVRG